MTGIEFLCYLKEKHRDILGNNNKTSWLAPDGTFILILGATHNYVARIYLFKNELVKHNYKTHNYDDILIEKGWVKINRSVRCWSLSKCTSPQIEEILTIMEEKLILEVEE